MVTRISGAPVTWDETALDEDVMTWFSTAPLVPVEGAIAEDVMS